MSYKASNSKAADILCILPYALKKYPLKAPLLEIFKH